MLSLSIHQLFLFSVVTLATPVPQAGPSSIPETFVLPSPVDGPGPTFDVTATRAATGAQIRNAASPNICFDVSDFRAGDFRFNLVPIALKECNSSIAGQKFDFITKGTHNNVVDGSRTIIASSQQFTCVDGTSNINDRTRPGLFACGGRAVGDGETNANQQFFFDSNSSLSGGIGLPIVNNAVNNGLGDGNSCLTLNADGFLSNAACSPPNFALEQIWIVDDPSLFSAPLSSPAGTSTSVASSYPSASTVIATPPSSSVTSVTPISPETFVLPQPADGPGPTFDTTAVRAATSVQIKSAASPNTCFDVSDFRAGDFRFNLVPIALRPCNSTIAGQRFDLIVKGKHNNVIDGSRTIIASSQQFTCVDGRGNINDRTRPGLFACGGRAVGDNETSPEQQFFFSRTANLSTGIGFPIVNNAVNDGVGDGNSCLTLGADGFLSNSPCSPPTLTPEQIWTLV